MAMRASRNSGDLSLALSVVGSRICSGFLRLLHKEASNYVRPASISLLRAAPPITAFKGLELDYDHGEKFCLSAEYLRVQSPSAETTRLTRYGARKVISGRRHVHILGLEPVGNYGIRIIYDDTHSTGIYTWEYLHDLGSKKLYYMRKYIKSLRDSSLSRDPLHEY